MNSCSCDQCKSACRYKPGWFMPGEAEKAAEHLGLSLQELFETKLGVDWWVDEPDVFVLAPATAGMEPGAEYSAKPSGQCVFFADGLCSIYPARPFECRELHHDDSRDDGYARHELVADNWRGNQEQTKELLGREPLASALSFFELIDAVRGGRL